MRRSDRPKSMVKLFSWGYFEVVVRIFMFEIIESRMRQLRVRYILSRQDPLQRRARQRTRDRHAGPLVRERGDTHFEIGPGGLQQKLEPRHHLTRLRRSEGTRL